MRNRFITLATVLPVISVLSAGAANAQDDKDKFKARYESNAVNMERLVCRVIRGNLRTDERSRRLQQRISRPRSGKAETINLSCDIVNLFAEISRVDGKRSLVHHPLP